MRALPFLTIAVLGIAACGGKDGIAPVEGPPALSIVSGNNQTAVAGTTQLPDPVVGQLVKIKIADGRSRFVFVKSAYAQTVVNGSPIAGAVVCAVELVEGAMKPFVPCTNTDALGKAVFFFEPGKKAGNHRSEIRGILNGLPTVFDTAKATIIVGPLDRQYQVQSPILSKPAVVPADGVRDIYANPFPFRVVSDSLLTAASDVFGTVGSRTITWDTPTVLKSNRIARLVDASGAQVAKLDYSLRPDGTISWTVRGLDR